MALDGATTLVGVTSVDNRVYDSVDEGAAYFGLLELGDGSPCGTLAQACATGFCVDGVCCDTACGGGALGDCLACSIAAGASVAGVCTSVSGRACDDGLYCNGADTCAAGVCNVHSGSPCPGTDGDADCTESCRESNDDCNGLDPEGSLCTDGVFCNGTDTCASGVCSVHSGNPCPGPDGDANCVESCNEGADNCTTNDPNGSPCSNGLFCDGTETCNGGACGGSTGNPCPGADGDGNCAESCDEAVDNCGAADPDGSQCTDGAYCNGTDTCAAGACNVHTGDPCPGADGDGNCAESCDEAADNCGSADPGGSPCTDGVYCNGTDTCAAGACTAHTGDPCPGADGDGDCAESCDESADDCGASDPGGSACTDGVFCNGTDTCTSGACTVHAGDPCPGPDGDGDCAESCDEGADNCGASDPGGASCTNGVFCDGTETCISGVCGSSTGDPCPGPDGDANCAESCNEAADNCGAADLDGSDCTDGAYCNGADTCVGGTCDSHAGDPCPGADGDGNCAESCDEGADNCGAADPDGSSCTDGTYCNGADSCAAGACSAHAGDPCPGPDGDGDCAESCDEAADNCAGADASGTSCTDGLYCNGAESCTAGACGDSSGDPCLASVGDGDPSCTEACDESTDTCTAPEPDGTACDDPSAACPGAESCTTGACTCPALGCPGPDGDDDCSETYDPVSDTCTAPDPDGTACTDGLYCNGTEVCGAGACGSPTGDPCPVADGDDDCDEACDEDADACTAAEPNGTPCDDPSAACPGAESCTGGACGCPVLGCPGPDGDADCAESYDSDSDTCTAADPDASSCDDGLFCNGAETCSQGACGDSAGDPCPGADGDAECAESCDEDADACTGVDPDGSACDGGECEDGECVPRVSNVVPVGCSCATGAGGLELLVLAASGFAWRRRRSPH